MTKTFECDGCGTTFPIRQIMAEIQYRDKDSEYNHRSISFEYYLDLCLDCYEATKQFLEERKEERKDAQFANFPYSISPVSWTGVGSAINSLTSSPVSWTTANTSGQVITVDTEGKVKLAAPKETVTQTATIDARKLFSPKKKKKQTKKRNKPKRASQ